MLLNIFTAVVIIFISAIGGWQLTTGTWYGVALAAVDFALAGINIWLMYRRAYFNGKIAYLERY